MATPTTTTASTSPTQTAGLATTQGTQKPGASPVTTPAATPAEVRRLKLKLEGQEVELPESEVISLAQRGKVADQRFQEAATTRKEAQEIIAFAKANPTEFFKRTGLNARQWAEEFLMGELKREQMTPEQKKAADNEIKLKEYESERKRLDAQKLEDEKQAAQQKHMQNYDKLFVEALGKSGLPKTAYTIKRMAELQLVNLKQKLNLDADQLAKVVREDYIAEQKQLYGALDGDQLIEMLGPEMVKKLSKAQIAKLKAKASGGSSATQPRSSNEKPPMSWREYQRRNRRLI